MATVASWDELPPLAEIGPPMSLPRRLAPPRNVRSLELPPDLNRMADDADDSWDSLDYMTMFGAAVGAAGFVLALWPETRRWGAMVPIGFLLIAIAAYLARGKDAAEA